MIYVTGVINTGLIMKNASYCFFRYSVPGKGRFVLRDFRTTIHKMAICWIEPFPKLTVWGEIILLLNSVLRAIFPLLLHKASYVSSPDCNLWCRENYISLCFPSRNHTAALLQEQRANVMLLFFSRASMCVHRQMGKHAGDTVFPSPAKLCVWEYAFLSIA